MLDRVAVQETINAARADIWRAVKIDPGRRALEGDIESAFNCLGSAGDALAEGDIAYARDAVTESLELLRTDESRLIIAMDTAALDDAIQRLDGIRWD